MANFFQLKKRISIKQVMDHYNMEYEEVKRELHAECPICGGAFKANTDKNCWNCFGDSDKHGGNILDLVKKMENVGVKKAGDLLEEWFPSTSVPPKVKPLSQEILRGKIPSMINAPIAVRLDLDPTETPFKESTAKYFDGGYCKKGMHRGTVAIPIKDADGEIVAYAGINDAGEVKYPKGYKLGIDVYNVHNTGKVAYLVDSFYDVWKKYEEGKHAICLIGPIKKRHIYYMERSGIKALILESFFKEEDLIKLARYFFIKLPNE